jgi:hypothetical protein
MVMVMKTQFPHGNLVKFFFVTIEPSLKNTLTQNLLGSLLYLWNLRELEQNIIYNGILNYNRI